MVRTIIVVPCYNEAERLDVDRIIRFAKTHPKIGLLFVNDGSRDQTWEVLERLQATVPGTIQRFNLETNSGKAEAIRQGICKALTQSPDYVGYWDADLATPLEAIPQLRNVFVTHPEKVMVMGSRVCLLGRHVQRTACRSFLGKVFATVASCVLRLSVHDTQCGAKMFRAGWLHDRIWETPFLSRWIFDVEILARMSEVYGNLHNLVYEYPLEQWHDVPGSKLRSKDFIIAATDLVRIWRTYKINPETLPIPCQALDQMRKSA